MSSINPVFQPNGPTVAVTAGTSVQVNASPSNNLGDCFRIVNTTGDVASTPVFTRIGWGRTAALAAAAVAGGIAGPNNMFLTPNESIYLCLPADSWFAVATSGTAEVTPGTGGAGG